MKNKTVISVNLSKIFRSGFIILALAVQIFPHSGVLSSCNSNNSNKNLRYPNELAGFKFYENAKWNKLGFLVSTMEDVRRVMGEPSKVTDTAQLAVPYPGDEKSLQPVFIYNGEQWDIHIYFGKYCYYTAELPENYNNRLCEIVLHPKEMIPADKINFSNNFARETKKFPDGSWDEYKDAYGLTYIVNYNEKDKLKYLGNITYGISKAELEKVRKKPSTKNDD